MVTKEEYKKWVKNNPEKEFERRRKISNSLKGRLIHPITNEMKKKISKSVSKTLKEQYASGERISAVKGKKWKWSEEQKSKVKGKFGKWMKGRKLSDKTKKRISETSIKRGVQKLENNPAWQGGISFEPYGLEFNSKLKNKIRKKYNFRCQECFRHQNELRTKTNRKYNLHIHHIDYDKKNNKEENLIPLCRECHLQTNFKRNDWVDYFKEKVVQSGL